MAFLRALKVFVVAQAVEAAPVRASPQVTSLQKGSSPRTSFRRGVRSVAGHADLPSTAAPSASSASSASATLLLQLTVDLDAAKGIVFEDKESLRVQTVLGPVKSAIEEKSKADDADVNINMYLGRVLTEVSWTPRTAEKSHVEKRLRKFKDLIQALSEATASEATEVSLFFSQKPRSMDPAGRRTSFLQDFRSSILQEGKVDPKEPSVRKWVGCCDLLRKLFVVLVVLYLLGFVAVLHSHHIQAGKHGLDRTGQKIGFLYPLSSDGWSKVKDHFAPLAGFVCLVVFVIITKCCMLRSDRAEFNVDERVKVVGSRYPDFKGAIGTITKQNGGWPSRFLCSTEFHVTVSFTSVCVGSPADVLTLYASEIELAEHLPSSFIDHSASIISFDTAKLRMHRDPHPESESSSMCCWFFTAKGREYSFQRALRVLFGLGGEQVFFFMIVLGDGAGTVGKCLVVFLVIGALCASGYLVFLVRKEHKRQQKASVPKPVPKAPNVGTLLKTRLLFLKQVKQDEMEQEMEQTEGLFSMILMLGIGLLVMNLIFGMQIWRSYNNAGQTQQGQDFGSAANIMIGNLAKFARVIMGFWVNSGSIENAVISFFPSELILMGLSAICIQVFKSNGVDFNPTNKEEVFGHFVLLVGENVVKTVLCGIWLKMYTTHCAETEWFVKKFLERMNNHSPYRLLTVVLLTHGLFDGVQFCVTNQVKESAKNKGVKTQRFQIMARAASEFSYSQPTDILVGNANGLKTELQRALECKSDDVQKDIDCFVMEYIVHCFVKGFDSKNRMEYLEEFLNPANWPLCIGETFYGTCSLKKVARWSTETCIQIEEWVNRGVTMPALWQIGKGSGNAPCPVSEDPFLFCLLGTNDRKKIKQQASAAFGKLQKHNETMASYMAEFAI